MQIQKLRSLRRATKRGIARSVPLLLLLGLQHVTTVACAKGSEEDSNSATANSELLSSDYRPEVPLLWDNVVPAGFQWTDFTIQTIITYGAALEKGARDVEAFCPNYNNLTQARKVNFWAHLVSAITKYETDFDPLSRYRETTMGVDAITKQHVYSEGLMQLSYQDVEANPFCNEFNWPADSKLDPKDPRKTILDPYKNLRCGIQILNRQVQQYGAISYHNGQYWSTLRPGNSRLAHIKALTNQIAFCRR